MLGICGNYEVILEKSFPLVWKGESNYSSGNVTLQDQQRVYGKKCFFCQWLENSVIPQVSAEACTLTNFRYCPLVWMFVEIIVTTWYENSLSTAIYNIQTKTYHNLLRINSKNDIQTQKNQLLMTDTYKCNV